VHFDSGGGGAAARGGGGQPGRGGHAVLLHAAASLGRLSAATATSASAARGAVFAGKAHLTGGEGVE
jgi:hypothetical protein